jgi:hypothetical protein
VGVLWLRSGLKAGRMEVGGAEGLCGSGGTDGAGRSQLALGRFCNRLSGGLTRRSLNSCAVSLYLSFATINLVIGIILHPPIHASPRLHSHHQEPLKHPFPSHSN